MHACHVIMHTDKGSVYEHEIVGELHDCHHFDKLRICGYAEFGK
jgi:hypothetical protein